MNQEFFLFLLFFCSKLNKHGQGQFQGLHQVVLIKSDEFYSIETCKYLLISCGG